MLLLLDDGQFEQFNRQALALKFKCDKMIDCETHVAILKEKHRTLMEWTKFTYTLIEKALREQHIGPIAYISERVYSAEKQNMKEELDLIQCKVIN